MLVAVIATGCTLTSEPMLDPRDGGIDAPLEDAAIDAPRGDARVHVRAGRAGLLGRRPLRLRRRARHAHRGDRLPRRL